MNKGIATFFNSKNTKSLLRMFDRKKNNRRGMMWATVLGLGVSAATVLGFNNKNRHTRNKDRENPIKNTMNRTSEKRNDLPPNLAAMAAEFSKELGLDEDSTSSRK